MANSKISALTAATSFATTDMLVIATAAGATKKIVGAKLPGFELDYAENTAGTTTITATSDATAETIISGAAVSYDGSTRVSIEWYFYAVDVSASQAILLNLYDGATDLGRIGNLGSPGGAAALSGSLVGHRFLTPSNASHTYHIKAWKTGGTARIYTGAGGTGTAVPGFMRIVKA